METDIEWLAVGNAVLRKEDQNPALREDYTTKYELD
jgi:carbamoyltransferase